MSTLPDISALAAALDGQYEFLREVGRGGMGVVYLARDLKLARPVAIKILPAHLSADPAVRERFLREARTAASLSHPHIVPVHRADELAGTVFFVMGYVDGAPISQVIRERGRLTPRELLPLLRDVGSALAYAHRLGVVHRDVKAENILVDRTTGRAMVTDFGIARLAEATPLTATGTMLGTVHYMSPEQVSGGVVDGRSDLYSLGVLAFLALAGRFPFEHGLASAILVAHVMQAPPMLQSVAPDVPACVADIVDQLLRKNPADRFQDGEELLASIDEATALLAAAGVPAAPLILSSTEAHAVWERAALLQDMTGNVMPMPPLPSRGSNSPSEGPPTSGYRLDVAREAAAEVGIAPKYFDRAIAELRAPPPGSMSLRENTGARRNPFLGEATVISYEATVDGEMPERDFDVMVDHIMRSLNDPGQVTAVGRSLNWSSSDRQRKVAISVLVRGGRTNIYVTERLQQIAGGLFGGIVGGAGGGMIGPSIVIGTQVLHSGAATAGLATVFVATAYSIARTIYTRIAGGRRRVLRELCDRLAQQALESIESGKLPPEPARRRLRE